MIGAMTDVFAGGGLPGDASVRDRFMADTLLWHLDEAPRDRIVVVAHNNHVQRRLSSSAASSRPTRWATTCTGCSAPTTGRWR
jgi:hypothetical protein